MFQMTPEAARAFLSEAPVVHLATVDGEGRPILRTVHGVLIGDAVAFHGSPVGEKQEAIGRPAVMGAEEIVASVPSYFTDPERACPATTYYRSVQVHGVIEEVTDPPQKAAMLQALMRKFQPEGGHLPISADHPLYAKAVAGIQVLQLPIAHMDGKAKLGQNLRPEQAGGMIGQLWRRGAAGDPRAIDLVCQANPAVALPDFLNAPAGLRLRCAVRPEEVRAAFGQGTLHPATVGDLQAALALPTAVWVGAVDEEGRLVAVMAGAGDGRRARILASAETAGLPEGVLARLAALLADHPALRQATVWETMADPAGVRA
jgi:nitroimidazol reductase NimA-like FMN-containing flavoprotein (pyridoxamine 5'-phosphate oxidase superfamily)